jgi:uncharacterized Zn finger protein (UPF0148 family)
MEQRCSACVHSISGEHVVLQSHLYHSGCFRCVSCDTALRDAAAVFQEALGLYCDICHTQKHAPRCKACGDQICESTFASALGSSWHTACFACANCAATLADGYHERDGQPLCSRCAAPHCAGCSEPMLERITSALGRQWHPRCFACGDCAAAASKRGESPPPLERFHERDGAAYCRRHFNARFAPKCARCARPIVEGRSVTVSSGEAYHEECFVCAECAAAVRHDASFAHDGDVFCATCYHERVSERCAGCARPIVEGKVIALGTARYHARCFACSACSCALSGTRSEAPASAKTSAPASYVREGRPWCAACFAAECGTPCACCGVSQLKWIVQAEQTLCHACTDSGARCFSCERVFLLRGDGASTPAPARSLADGRVVCLRCDASAVTTVEEAAATLAAVQRFFTSLGFRAFTDRSDASALLRPEEVPLRLEERGALREMCAAHGRVGRHVEAPLGLTVSSICTQKEVVVETLTRETTTPSPLPAARGPTAGARRGRGRRARAGEASAAFGSPVLVEPERVVCTNVRRRNSMQVEVETVRRRVSKQHFALTTPPARGGSARPAVVRRSGGARRTSVETTTSTSREMHSVNSIAVLRGMPWVQLSAVLAHELCHAFLKLKRFPALDPTAEEGMCELWAHLWLTHVAEGGGAADAARETGEGAAAGAVEEARRRLRRMETNSDPVYGGGLRAALDVFRRSVAASTREDSAAKVDGDGDGASALAALTGMLKGLRRTRASFG